MKGVQVHGFTTDIQRRFVYRELLCRTEVSVRTQEASAIEGWNRCPGKTLEGGGWGEDTGLVRL